MRHFTSQPFDLTWIRGSKVESQKKKKTKDGYTKLTLEGMIAKVIKDQ
jgi:hypothetical protein